MSMAYPSSDYILWPAPVSGRVLKFTGICMVDEFSDNQNTKYPGVNVANNQGTALGVPYDRQWLLLKADQPFTPSDSQICCFPMDLTANMDTAYRYWWEYYLITENFWTEDVGSHACATWNTKPAMYFGRDGMVDWGVGGGGGQVLTPGTLRELTVTTKVWGNHFKSYGICLRPHDQFAWYLNGTGLTSTHTVDFARWFIISP
jgi:hypothetical protein